MAEYVLNPRRSPRAPVRCRVKVITAQGPLEAETEDIGAHGVQVVSPRELRKGDVVRLVVTHRAVKDALEVAGKVSWSSAQAPWRVGIGFDDGSLKASRRWYEKLLDGVPGLPSGDRVPDRIAMDRSLFLGAPPRFVLDFTPDELAVLRAIGSGATLDDLKLRLRDRWIPSQRAVFSLMARNHVTLVRGEGVHPDTWKKILAELETSLALADLAPVVTPVPATARRPSQPGTPIVEVNRAARPGDQPRPPPRVPSTPAMPAARAPTVTSMPAVPPAGQARAVAEARPAPVQRDPDAQACLDRARAEIERGQVHTGVALLRRAQLLAPGDEEIAAALAAPAARR